MICTKKTENKILLIQSLQRNLWIVSFPCIFFPLQLSGWPVAKLSETRRKLIRADEVRPCLSVKPCHWVNYAISHGWGLGIFFLTTLLKYKSYTMQLTHLKYTIKWFWQNHKVVQPLPIFNFRTYQQCLFQPFHIHGIIQYGVLTLKQHNVFEVHLCDSMYQNFILFLLLKNISLHGDATFDFPTHLLMDMESFPLFDSHEQCCYNYLCTSSCVPVCISLGSSGGFSLKDYPEHFTQPT